MAYSSDGRYLARFEDVVELSWPHVPRILTAKERFDLLGDVHAPAGHHECAASLWEGRKWPLPQEE